MPKKIESLTLEQEAKLAEYRDKWIRIGLSTEPANRPEAERAIRMAYESAGKKHPKIVWCGSPATLGLTRAIVQKIAKYFGRTPVSDSRWGSVWDTMGDSVWGFVWDSVWDSVSDSVRDFVWRFVWDSVRDSVRDSVLTTCFWQHDAHWLGFYDYFRQVCGLVEETKPLEGLTLLAQNAGWFLPYEHICWVTERPNTLILDDQGRLHCENGPALTYPDGFSIWAWHGVPVPQYVIEFPESITIKRIRYENNAEVRRVMVERMGWDKFCSQAGMRVIHEDELHAKFPAIPISDLVEYGKRLVTEYRPGIEKAQLLESTELTDFEERPLRFVRLTDPSTGRQYTLRVKHDHQRCYEAVAWTFGLTEEEYKHGKFVRQGDVLLNPLLGGPDHQFHS